MNMLRARATMGCLAFALTCALVFAPALPTADAAPQRHEDTARGFALSLDGRFDPIPPKPSTTPPYLAAHWFVDKERYEGKLSPTFQVLWFDENAPEPPPSQFPTLRPPRTVEAYLERFTSKSAYFPLLTYPWEKRAARPGASATLQTRAGPLCEVVYISNSASKGVRRGVHVRLAREGSFLMVGRLTLKRPSGNVEVGFLGCCRSKERNPWQASFEKAIQSFEVLDVPAAGKNTVKDIHAMSPEEFRAHVKETKMVRGWSAVDTEHYLILHNDEVPKKLVKLVKTHLDALREQLLEKWFPPDRPITKISVVRVCKNEAEYLRYGGPAKSAGHWSVANNELVIFPDPGSKKNTLAVLQHEAFHQYIYYSVGEITPHAWFNEGHGDYFAGHQFKFGRFVEKPFDWRESLAVEVKRSRAPKLRHWLRWDKELYYQGTYGIYSSGENYALGWSFIYFLRRTKNPAYSKILPRYFDSLKSSLTSYHNALAGWERDVAPLLETLQSEKDKSLLPKRPERDDVAWLDLAVLVGFKGIDLEKLREDWIAD